MPVYNGEKYVSAAIDSILAQTFRAFELIIVDDGSTDGTRAILGRYRDGRIRVIRNRKNLGLPKALNRGLDAAQCELVARHDADDLSYPERLAKQVAFLDRRPDVILAGTRVRLIDSRGRRLWRQSYKSITPESIAWQLLTDNPFCHPTVMFRRDGIRYDERFSWGEDLELWSRLMSEHRVANLDEPLLDQRAHAQAFTSRRDAAMAAMRRTGMERYRALCRDNVLRILGDERLADEWPLLRTRIDFRWALREPCDASQALDVLAAMAERFDERYGPPNEDVQHHRAWYLAIVASRLALHSRRAGLRAFARAAASAPKTALPFGASLAKSSIRRD